MSADFTKLQFPAVANPNAPTLTEAIAWDPVAAGFVVLTCRADDAAALVVALRAFAAQLRADAGDSGLCDVTAYRQLRRDELGGAVPFDQPVCEELLQRAAKDQAATGRVFDAESIVLGNPRADWVLLLEYRSPAQALNASQAMSRELGSLANAVTEYTVGSFLNKRQYARVPRNADLIHFFNLFPSPGDVDVLWPAWEASLPWFFDAAEVRSSFPLLALEPDQPILLVNYAHFDSVKHFLMGILYDPDFVELMGANYAANNVTFPMPFFCKIVPV